MILVLQSKIQDLAVLLFEGFVDSSLGCNVNRYTLFEGVHGFISGLQCALLYIV